MRLIAATLAAALTLAGLAACAPPDSPPEPVVARDQIPIGVPQHGAYVSAGLEATAAVDAGLTLIDAGDGGYWAIDPARGVPPSLVDGLRRQLDAAVVDGDRIEPIVRNAIDALTAAGLNPAAIVPGTPGANPVEIIGPTGLEGRGFAYADAITVTTGYDVVDLVTEP